jgi:nitronate monooxygenase
MAPMAGASPPALAVAVTRAGGMGGCGALMMTPDAIADWVAVVRAETDGPVQLNLWIPDPPPLRDAAAEARVRGFLAAWGSTASTAEAPAGVDFAAQCEALLAAHPAVISSIMGVYPPDLVAWIKACGIAWFATATTVAEAVAAADAGADAIVAQGAEAGGHRGAFAVETAETRAIGLFALLPAVVDAVRVPVVASSGIADARGVAAVFMLGAAAVQIGTGLLRTPEAGIARAWADALADARPEDTTLTRAFSGRAGRSLRKAYVRAAAEAEAPPSAPYPVQRARTATMRAEAAAHGDLDRLQAWAGQAAALAPAVPADAVVGALWDGARELLTGTRAG